MARSFDRVGRWGWFGFVLVLAAGCGGGEPDVPGPERDASNGSGVGADAGAGDVVRNDTGTLPDGANVSDTARDAALEDASGADRAPDAPALQDAGAGDGAEGGASSDMGSGDVADAPDAQDTARPSDVADASAPETGADAVDAGGAADGGDGNPSRDVAPPLDADAGAIDSAGDAFADAIDGGADDARGDAGDGSSACPALPPIVPLGNFQNANCGAFEVSAVVPGEAGVLYLVSLPLRRIVGWSGVTGACSAPISLGISPKYVAYSNVNHRLYVAYATGAITSIDPASPTEQAFSSTPLETRGLATAGQFVVAADATSPWATHYVFNPQGALVASKDWNHISTHYEWSDATRRMYYFRDGSSPNDLMFEQIDCVTGAIVASGESPYHGSYDIGGPIRASVDGQSVLIGGGEIYNGVSIQRVGSLPGVIKDAAWLPNGKLLVLRDAGATSVVEQRGGLLLRVENLQRFDGGAVALRSAGDGAVVVTLTGTSASLSVYHENVDGDGDGVAFADDAFPLDKAASVDTDHDGHPDHWNSGQTGSGSALTLDAFPLASACHLAGQAVPGDPSRCDVAGTIPAYTPTSIEFDGTDELYLLSRADKRVFRYSTVRAAHDNPFVLEREASMAIYLASQARLYVAYDDGAISRFDAAGGKEMEFAAVPGQPHGLGAVGNFLLAADPSGAWESHFTFGASGAFISEVDWNYRSREYAFSPATSRVYFFRDSQSPNDLHWEVIDQGTGVITGEGESPYHGDYAMTRPIRVSQDGGYVLTGAGDVYDGVMLNRQLTLGITLLDAAWLPGNGVVALTADGTLRWFNSSFQPGATRAVTGTPLRVFWSAGKLVVVTLVNGKPAFETIPI